MSMRLEEKSLEEASFFKIMVRNLHIFWYSCLDCSDSSPSSPLLLLNFFTNSMILSFYISGSRIFGLCYISSFG